MSQLLSYCYTDINFPNLGLYFKNVRDGFTVFGFKIALYGIFVAMGMVFGYLLTEYVAKKTGQNSENYLDFVIIAIILGVACARLYYVAFNWEAFADHPLSIFNLRTGGLAIYGGAIAGILTALIFARVKKLNSAQFLDTAIVGLTLGQIIGRFGNFVNREAFGTYTNGLFAMQVDVRDAASYFNPATSLTYVQNLFAGKPEALANVMKIRDNAIVTETATYIQVHPTFLYEALWNLMLLILMLVLTKYKRFHGQISLVYLMGYGLGRFWIEGLRTDQLFLWKTGIPVSQIVSLTFVAIGVITYTLVMVRIKRKKSENKGDVEIK